MVHFWLLCFYMCLISVFIRLGVVICNKSNDIFSMSAGGAVRIPTHHVKVIDGMTALTFRDTVFEIISAQGVTEPLVEI